MQRLLLRSLRGVLTWLRASGPLLPQRDDVLRRVDARGGPASALVSEDGATAEARGNLAERRHRRSGRAA
jgi:hypothetical protein